MLFMGTFFICLFIFMMQFLWKYVDEMVGKGLEMSVLAQFFFYSALTLVPASLPLAILLAALITFGNFGERFEDYAPVDCVYHFHLWRFFLFPKCNRTEGTD